MSRYVDADSAKVYLNSAACEQIKRMPTVNVRKVRRGEWIPDAYEYYHCSRCGFENDEREYVTPYCPQCGAKMDLEELK